MCIALSDRGNGAAVATSDGQSMESNRPPSSEARKRQTSPVVSTICRSLVMTCGRTAGRGGSDAASSAYRTGGLVMLVRRVSGKDAHSARVEKHSHAWPSRSGCNAAAWWISASNRQGCAGVPESLLRDGEQVTRPPRPQPRYDASCAKKDRQS